MSRAVLTNMVMLEADGKVLVIDRVKSFPGIAFPGGHTETGESIYDSAIREFWEETGLTVSNLESKGFIYWENEEYLYFTFFYRVTEYTGELKEGGSEGKVFWLDKEKLREQKLAPNMDKYLVMFENHYTECFCTYKDGHIPHFK